MVSAARDNGSGELDFISLMTCLLIINHILRWSPGGEKFSGSLFKAKSCHLGREPPHSVVSLSSKTIDSCNTGFSSV